MKYIILPVFVFVSILLARENPFSQSSLQGNGVGSVQPQTSALMEPEKLRLPVDAVRLKKVTVTYQMIDGKIETRTFVIEKSIAPDKNLVIDQQP